MNTLNLNKTVNGREMENTNTLLLRHLEDFL
jgi:hypothetical protein